MALFLLISIGSVCASDTAMNSGILANESTSTGEITPTPTTVDASDAIINENDPQEIPVTVQDNESQSIGITTGDLNVTENNKVIKFEYNNSKIIITDKLAIGNHSLIISYLGNANYTNSSTKILLSIFGNKTITEAPASVVANGNEVEIPIVISDGVKNWDASKDDLTLNLTYTDKNGSAISRLIEEIAVDNNIIKFALDNTKFVSSNVVITYTGEGKSSKTVAIKLPSKVTAENITASENEAKDIKISVFDGETPLNITKNDLNILEGTKNLEFTYSNSTVTITSSLSKGKHNIIIKYVGNATFAESSTSSIVSVYGNLTIETPTNSVNVNSTKKVEITMNVTNGINKTAFTKEDIKINVTYIDGNETKVVAIKDNDFELVGETIKFELESGDFKALNLTITYKDDISKTITLNRIYNAIITPVTSENYYSLGNFTFLVVDADTGEKLANQSISVSGKSTTLYWITSSSSGSYSISSSTTLKTDADGIATMKNRDFYPGLNIGTYIFAPVGEYNLTVSGTGDVKGSNVTTITIKKAEIKITINKYEEYYGSDKKAKIVVTNIPTGDPMAGIVVFFNLTDSSGKEIVFTTTQNNNTTKVNNAYTNENGIVELPVSNLPKGTYSLFASVNGTSNYDGNNKTNKNIKVKGIPLKYTFSTTTVYYNSGQTLTITVKDKNTGKVVPNALILVEFKNKKSVNIYPVSNNNIYRVNNHTYIYQTNSKGKITIAASLAVGKHKIAITSADSRYASGTSTKTMTVKKATGKFSASKVTAYHKDGKTFIVKLTNKNTNKAMYGAKVLLKIYPANSKSYYILRGYTGADGKLRLNLDSFKPGTYKVEVGSSETKNYVAAKLTSQFVIKKTSAKITASKVNASEGANKYFKVTVKNTATKKAVIDVALKVKVTGKIKATGKSFSKTYTIKTNAKGIAQLSTKSLKAGTYNAVVTSGDKYCTAKSVSAKITIK